MSYVDVLVSELVDWITQPNTPSKETLATFSLGLTPEGLQIRDAALALLRPVVEYSRKGNAVLISSRFPKHTLTRIAQKAVQRLPQYDTEGGLHATQ